MNFKDAGQTIKETVSAIQVAELYGYHPDRAGYIPCPFHAERTGSCRIYARPGKGWHCFGCGQGGSVLDFVMLHEGCTFNDAVKIIDKQLNLGLLGVDDPFEASKNAVKSTQIAHAGNLMNEWLDDAETLVRRNLHALFRRLQEAESTPAEFRSLHEWNVIIEVREEVDFFTDQLEQINEARREVRAWKTAAIKLA